MFERQLLKQRMERAYRALNELDVDLWISIGRETHFTSEPALLYLLPAPALFACAVVVERSGQSVCLVGALDQEEMETYGSFTRVVAHRGDFEQRLTEILRGFMPARRVALNYSQADASADGLSLTDYRLLERCFAAAGFAGETISSHGVMRRVRAQKSPEEVAGIERAVRAAMQIYEGARGALRGGMSGGDIQRYFQRQVAAIGGEYSWPRTGNPYVSVGARSSYLCKRPPDDVAARPGDLINVDFGLRLGGFASDNQRSFYVLEPGEREAPEEVRRAFETVQAANRAAIEAAAPGVPTTVPRDCANRVFERQGYPPVRSLGHEIGTFAHEGGMRLGADDPFGEMDARLEEGMCFTLEPAILTSRGRLCQEEVVTISRNGCRLLSEPQREVWLIDAAAI